MLCLRSFNRFILFSLALFGLSVSSVNAATAIFDAGQLTGIDQVDVSGSLYDVTFNGSYSGVTYGDEFSRSATEALTTLFLTGGQFSTDPIDIDPELTFGCTLGQLCSIGTVATQLNATEIIDIYTLDNWQGPFDFLDGSAVIPFPTLITSLNDQESFTYADWTLTNVGVVPVPAAVWLFGPALIGLIGFGKRRKAA